MWLLAKPVFLRMASRAAPSQVCLMGGSGMSGGKISPTLLASSKWKEEAPAGPACCRRQ